jgi:plastocyanin
VKENVVTYTDAGYSPNALTIKKGETVTFKNQSSRSMWPASAIHPTHRVYSGTSLDEHCPDTAGTAFDACKGFLPSQSWSFTFNKTGTWKYHDHLNPGATGVVVVE